MSTVKALNRLASAWPKDPIRPHLQFGELLQYIAESTPADKISARTVGAVKALEDNELMKKVGALGCPVFHKITNMDLFLSTRYRQK